MSNFQVKGIVIKCVDFNESDKIITVLTFEKGKITCIAKGVQKPNAKLAHIARVFYCGTFEMVNTNQRNVLIGATMLMDLSGISSDLKKFYFAAHYVEIASSVVMEEQPDEDVMKLLLNTLYVLAKDKMDIRLLTVVYEFRIAALNGLAPYMDCCVECGSEKANMKFSVSEGGLVCCQEGFSIGDISCKTINYISLCDNKELYGFTVPETTINELYFISRKYIERVFERKFDKADQYDKESMGG
ncbi:MAG: DNA repair protein RecO [Clostridia bacterium]|nr:DNA repair protein RecO [Clostridia bacterium]